MNYLIKNVLYFIIEVAPTNAGAPMMASGPNSDPVFLDAEALLRDAAKKDEEKKEIAIAINIHQMKAEFDALVFHIQQTEAQREKALAEADQARQEAKDRQDKELLMAAQEAYYAAQEKQRLGLVSELNSSIHDLDVKIKALDDEIRRITADWGGSTLQQGLDYYSQTIGVGANGESLADKAERLFFSSIDAAALDVKVNDISLRERLVSNIQEAFKNYIADFKDPNSSKDPVQMQVKTLAMPAQINEHIAEHNKAIKEHNKGLPPDQHIPLVEYIKMDVAKLVDYANEHWHQTLGIFHNAMQAFLSLGELTKLRDQFQAEKQELRGLASKNASGGLPPMQNVSIQIMPTANAIMGYDCDAGTHLSMNTLNPMLVSNYARDVEAKLGIKVSTEQTGSYVKLTMATTPQSSIVVNTDSHIIAANNANHETLNAILILAKKINGTNPIDIHASPNAIDALSSASRSMGLNAELQGKSTPNLGVEAKPEMVVAPVSPSVPQAPPLSPGASKL